MVFRKGLVLWIFMIFCVGGCDAIQQAGLIPSQKLTAQQKEQITQAIASRNHSSLRSIGKPAVPLIIKEILTAANNPAQSQDVRASSDACNFIYDLGAIRDPRAVPALSHILNDVQKRTSHPAVARALGQIGDKKAVGALKTAFKREKGYIAKGKRKGPDYGWGLSGDFSYQVAQNVGTALRRLGENPGEIPKDKMTQMQEEFQRMRRE